MQKRHIARGGFALPTVLIASVVMLTILAVSVSSVATVRTSLKAQHYEQLAKIAGEAGVAFAKACLAKNSNIPLWTDDKPLTPATDCAGNLLLGPAVQVLVVGGGGGGGAGLGGGGGGGGVQMSDWVPVAVGTYQYTVGAGGTGAVSQATGGTGGASTIFGITASGGGGGGGRIASGATYTPAGDGASGGGGNGTRDAGTGSGAPGGAGTPGEGYDGGMGSASTTVNPYAGNGAGGGGAGGPGGDATGVAIDTGRSGDGGKGILSDISGQQIYYGAGGSGGRWGTGEVGIPGVTGGGMGGAGSAVAGTPGRVQVGAGGGGGSAGDGSGGAGGSGVVIFRYADNGSVVTSGSPYKSGPYRVNRYTAVGTNSFQVTSVAPSSCPSDPRCSVTVNDNLRSSFRVPRPAVDETGRAVTIPNTGYVELLRESNGQVWRTYRQPAAQKAVVPDLCSGAAASSLGWSNAVLSTDQANLPGITTARTITLANENLNAGRMYYRKDFTVTQAGTYNLAAQTSSLSDVVEIYVDGVLRTTAQNGVSNGSVTLTAGCHTITARLTNKTLLPRASHFTAAIHLVGSAPIVATDSSWRVSAGSSVPFSDPDFYADPTIWTAVGDLQNAQASVAAWGASSGDDQTHLITAPCNLTCPPSSSTYFRDSKDFILTQNTEVLVSALCDDDCMVYVDGNLVIAGSSWSSINQQTLTLTAGTHRIGARLYNGGSAANASKIAISVYSKDSSRVLTRTDTSWQTSSNQWIAGTNADNDPMSYEDSFRPSPQEIVDPVLYDLLVVGGGAGGGGNCATCGGAGGGGGGGVVYQTNTATPSTLTVTVGTGGAGGTGGASRTNGAYGVATTVASTVASTITAARGGGGGAQLGTAGLNGGSGGGGSGGGSPAPGAGGTGTAGQGYAGGAGVVGPQYTGGGGGGAGGTGMPGSAVGGDGGPGFITYITGTRMVVGAGGGGGAYGAVAAGEGDDDSAGDGATPTTNGGVGYAATANRGAGGGGGNGSTVGGAGGSGSAGITVIRFKKNSLTYTLGGAGTRTVNDIVVEGITYTVITFTAGTSTFSINTVTP